jgi:hypothetical protein
LFTSVDIANSIKSDGTWVRNSEVASWLRSNALNNTPSYTSTKITVSNNKEATLYYPSNLNPDSYTNRDQEALSPVTPKAALSVDKTQISPDKDLRLRIPAVLVKELGLNPGDKVDKSKILVNAEDISEDLIVHADGRIAFPRKCLAWGIDPVLVFVNNGFLCFEKP